MSLTVVDMSLRPAGRSAVIELRLGIVGIVVEASIKGQTNYFDIDEAATAAERLAEEGG